MIDSKTKEKLDVLRRATSQLKDAPIGDRPKALANFECAVTRLESIKPEAEDSDEAEALNRIKWAAELALDHKGETCLLDGILSLLKSLDDSFV